MNGLQCYGLVDLIKKHADVSENAFCSKGNFHWSLAEFSKLLTPIFHEEGSNKKKIEVDIYKYSVDFVERCFEDGR